MRCREHLRFVQVQLIPNHECHLQPNPECKVWIFDGHTLSRRLQILYNSIPVQIAITLLALASIALPLYQLLEVETSAEQTVGDSNGWKTIYWFITLTLLARTVLKFAMKGLTYRWREWHHQTHNCTYLHTNRCCCLHTNRCCCLHTNRCCCLHTNRCCCLHTNP